jgi:hypothetical protein
MKLFSFFKKKQDDYVVVAKLRCGFKFLSKMDENGSIPYGQEVWLYEDSKGNRKVVEQGGVVIHRSTRKTLKDWKNHKIIISVIPNHYGIITGQLPYELDTTPSRMR